VTILGIAISAIANVVGAYALFMGSGPIDDEAKPPT